MVKLKKFKVDKSCSRDAVSKNISTAIHKGGAFQKQAVAIALDVAKRAGCDLKHLKKTKKTVHRKPAIKKTVSKKTASKKPAKKAKI